MQPYLWMLLGCVAFSLMGTLVHALGDRADWQLIAMARSSVPLTLMAALTLATGAKLVFFRPRVLWLRSIAGSVSMIGTFYALTRLPTADVFTLTNTFPLWIAVLSGPLLGEQPPLSVWLAVISGVVGVAIILQPHFEEGNLAVLAALAASFFTALAMIGLHRLQGIDPKAIVAHFSGVALLFNSAALVIVGSKHSLSALSEMGWFMLAGIGLSATIGQLFLTWAFSAGSPARVSVVGLMQIPFALCWDVILFQQTVQPLTLLGMPLVVLPAAWLMLHRPAKVPDEPAVPLDEEV